MEQDTAVSTDPEVQPAPGPSAPVTMIEAHGLSKYFGPFVAVQDGIFGKWHLGDTYPHRPQDQGG